MNSTDYISVIGSIITTGSMVVTIYYANKAKTYKKQIQKDIRKINLANIVDTLKKAQDETRKLPKAIPFKRGIKVDMIIVSIQYHFDNALNLLDSDGPETQIREFISKAQSSLHKYNTDFLNEKCNSEAVSSITKLLQEAISKSNTKIFVLEKDL